MAIGIVELQGTINRTQDYQQLQQHENERGAIFQNQQQEQVEQDVKAEVSLVHKKEDAGTDTETDERENKGYGGDGGRNRRKKKPQDRVIVKNTMAFDVKI
ncbi:MAG: hypothetical protein IJ600_04075 [Lachnospiraceae bacterium]|nr:hypothetical protein [Lachnospiraceae bacterium]